MKSPFPGMDPYIEACGLWGDFHHNLIAEIQAALARAAPERYFVRAGERSYIVLVEEEGKASHPFVPDVSVSTERRKKKKPSGKKSGTAVAEPVPSAEPVLMRAFIEEEHREAFVEIYEAALSSGWSRVLKSCRPPTSARARLVMNSTSASGKACSSEKRTWSRLICSAAAVACPCSIRGPTVPTRCWWPGQGSSTCVGSGQSTSR